MLLTLSAQLRHATTVARLAFPLVIPVPKSSVNIIDRMPRPTNSVVRYKTKFQDYRESETLSLETSKSNVSALGITAITRKKETF